MSTTAIYDTPEYKLASHDMQGWAFTHKDQYLSSVDAAEKMGMKLDNLKAKVKVNTGEEVEIPVSAKFYTVFPDSKFKSVKTPIDGVYVTAYMVKGSSPKNKTAIYFTHDDFISSQDVKKIIADIDAAAKEFRKQHNDKIKAELVKSHPPAAKKASKELPSLAKEEDAVQKVYDWFVKNGFSMGHVKPEHLKNFVSSIKKDGHVSSKFSISSKSDGYGHQTGTSGEIDFNNKRVGIYGWSSDD